MAKGSPPSGAWVESASHPLVVFGLDDQRYALPLETVEQVVRVVEITPLPRAPDVVLGVINVRGEVVPVYHPRKRFRFPQLSMNSSDHLLMARTGRRAVALAQTLSTLVTP